MKDDSNSAITVPSDTGIPVAHDVGMSALQTAKADEVILTNGQIVKLTGTEEDVLLVASDRNARVKQALSHVYLSGRNLAVAREVFVEQYGSAKIFWENLTKATGFSRSKLEGEIRLAEGYSQEQIALLMEAGCNQSLAISMLRAPAVKAQVLMEAAEGKRVTPEIVAELSACEEVDSEDDESTDQANQAAVSVKSNLKKASGTVGTVVTNDTTNATSASAPSTTTTTLELTPSNTNSEEQNARYIALFVQINKSRDSYDLSTVRGESIRRELAMIVATFYGVEIPQVEPQKDENSQIQELRKVVGGKKLTALQVMAYLDGHIDKMNGAVEMPNYKSLYSSSRVKTMDTVTVLETIWHFAYNIDR